MEDPVALPSASALLEANPHPLALLSPSGAVLVANAAWRDTFPESGLPADADDRAAVARGCEACLAGRRRMSCEVRGMQRRFVCHTWPADDTRVWASLEATVERTYQTLRELINNVPTNVYATDSQGTCLLSEGGLLASLGLKPEERVGTSIFADEEVLPDVSAAVRRAFAGTASTVEFSLMDRVFSQTTIPRRDAAGALDGVFCIVSEVTEKRRDEATLRDQLRIIQQQKSAILDLSTPIIEVWDDVLAAPLVGVIDSERAAVIMQSLLDAIATRRARHVILDLTGVDSVETASAEALVRIIRAITLLGAQAIVTGIQPAIAQTMVGLGLDMTAILTLRSLRDALRHSMHKRR